MGRLMDRFALARLFVCSALLEFGRDGHSLASSVLTFGLARFALAWVNQEIFRLDKNGSEWFPKKERALATASSMQGPT